MGAGSIALRSKTPFHIAAALMHVDAAFFWSVTCSSLSLSQVAAASAASWPPEELPHIPNFSGLYNIHLHLCAGSGSQIEYRGMGPEREPHCLDDIRLRPQHSRVLQGLLKLPGNYQVFLARACYHSPKRLHE